MQKTILGSQSEIFHAICFRLENTKMHRIMKLFRFEISRNFVGLELWAVSLFFSLLMTILGMVFGKLHVICFFMP